MKGVSEDVTLLLIEDDDVDALTIERSFEKHRIANPIVRAHDGVEGLEMLKGGAVAQPYIVLLDIQMPRMNGLAFLEELRSDPKLANTIVFVLTTSRDEKDIQASYTKNVAGYFVKEEAGDNFSNVVNLLQGYWKIVQFSE